MLIVRGSLAYSDVYLSLHTLLSLIQRGSSNMAPRYNNTAQKATTPGWPTIYGAMSMYFLKPKLRRQFDNKHHQSKQGDSVGW